jgi:hypothetical protein
MKTKAADALTKVRRRILPTSSPSCRTTMNLAEALTKAPDDDEPCRSAYQGATRRAQAIKDYSRFSSSHGAGGFPWGYGPEFGVALSRGPAINA